MNGGMDLLVTHGMYYGESSLDEIRAIADQFRSSLTEKEFQTVVSSACASQMLKLKKEGFLPK